MIETRIGDFEEALLLLIGIVGDDNAYAFRVAKEFSAQTGRNISVGSVHSTLDRLESKGYLKSSVKNATAERGGRRKRIFVVTALGKRVLKESLDFKMSLWRQHPTFSSSR